MRSLAPYALVGAVVGLGLGLGTNVSGAVLALYGLLAGAAFAAAARASATRSVALVALVALGVLAVVALLLAGGEDRRVAADLPLGDRPAVASRPAPATDDPVAREARPTQLERPDPADHPPGTPQRAAEEFLDAWHDRAWDRMAVWTAPLWRENLPDPAASLRFRFGVERLRGAYQRRFRRLGPDRASLVVDLAATKLTPELERRRVTMDLRREDGRWTVEPISIAPPRVEAADP